jgi:hypothetical protein
MRKLFSKAEEIYAGIANVADRKFSHSGCLKTGKLNRVQYNIRTGSLQRILMRKVDLALTKIIQ